MNYPCENVLRLREWGFLDYTTFRFEMTLWEKGDFFIPLRFIRNETREIEDFSTSFHSARNEKNKKSFHIRLTLTFVLKLFQLQN